jgi:drug/metabolite transporter (DMT)-like permease
VATALVGVSVPVTGLLAHYPVLTGQAIRYGIGALTLYVWLRRSGRRLPMPSRRDLLGLAGMVGPGMLGFNAAVLAAQRHAQPGLVAAMLGGAPLLLALLGEVLFTVSGMGVTAWLGVLETCVLACTLAAVLGVGVGFVTGGPTAWQLPTVPQAVALVVLGVLVTAVAFAGWYTCVSAMGADRAGVLIGLTPLSGLVTSVLLGAQPLTTLSTAGTLLVAAGCATALRRGAPVPV